MKRIFFVMLLLFAAIELVQAQYQPSLHTVVSRPIGMPKGSTDARSQFYDGTHFIYRDYVSTAEVLSYLNTGNYRTGKFPIYINAGGTVNPGTGVISGGTVSEYWFKDGVADFNLILKTSASNGITSFNTRTGDVILTGSDVSAALGFNPLSANYTGFDTRYVLADSAVIKFNGRRGNVTLLTGDVTGALGFTPLSSAYTGFDTRYQPLENQRLSIGDAPIFRGITIFGGTQTILRKTSGGGIESGLLVETYGSHDTVTQVLNIRATNSTANELNFNQINFQLLTPSPATGNTAWNYMLQRKNMTIAGLDDISALSTVYQPLENQRLGSTNNVSFASTKSGADLNSNTNQLVNSYIVSSYASTSSPLGAFRWYTTPGSVNKTTFGMYLRAYDISTGETGNLISIDGLGDLIATGSVSSSSVTTGPVNATNINLLSTPYLLALDAPGLTSSKAVHFQNKSGTVALTSDLLNQILSTNDLPGTQTASATILTYTTGSSTSVYEIGAYLTITAVSSSTDGVNVSYTDENGGAVTLPFIINAFATGQYSGSVLIRAKNNTSITISTTIAGGSVTYGAGGFVELKY